MAHIKKYTLSQQRDAYYSRVDRYGENDCWPYTGCKNQEGRGLSRYGDKLWVASQLAYMFAHDLTEWPEGMYACHTCHHPWCQNPKHIYPGTQKQNVADMYNAGRQNPAKGLRSGRYTKPERTARGDNHPSRLRPETRPRGDRHGTHLHPETVRRGESVNTCKLTAAKVLIIRDRHSAGVSAKSLAEKYGVTTTNIYDIVHFHTWKHVKQGLLT